MARLGLILSIGAVTVFVARLLGPDGSGHFAVVSGLFFSLLLLTTLGLELGLAWMVGARRWEPRSALASAWLAALMLGVLGVAIGMGIYLAASSTAFSGIEPGVALLALLALPPALVWTYSSQVALATQHYEAVLVIAMAQALSYAAAVATLTIPFGLAGAATGLFAGQLAGAAAAVIWGRRMAEAGGERLIDLGRLRKAIAFGVQAYAANTANVLMYRFDIFLLNAYAGAAEAGYYAVAATVTNGLGLLPAALNSVLLPRLASLSEESEATRRQLEDRAIRHAMLIVGVGSLTFAVLLPLLVEPIFGSDFAQAVEPGLILIPGAAAIGVAGTLSAILAGRGKPVYAMRIAFVVAPLAVGLYFVLVPMLGAEGAAIGSDIAYLTAAVLSAVALRRLSGPLPARRPIPGRAELHDYRLLWASVVRRLAQRREASSR